MSRLIAGECLEIMKMLPANYVDSIVTDPPYGWSFMGSTWDHGVPGVPFWAEMLRISKPGAYLLAFGGARTYHRLACAIEDAGWEIRDQLLHIQLQGFPKSQDVSKTFDGMACREAGLHPKGKEGEDEEKHNCRAALGGAKLGERTFGKTSTGQGSGWHPNAVAATGKQEMYGPQTDEAKQWTGWGSALKPSVEPIVMAQKPLNERGEADERCVIHTPIVMAQKPLSERNIALNLRRYGTGAINIDGCRIGEEKTLTTNGRGFDSLYQGGVNNNGGAEHDGRWPADVILTDAVFDGDYPDYVVGGGTSGPGNVPKRRSASAYPAFSQHEEMEPQKVGGVGGKSRYFLIPKASTKDRDSGVNGEIELEVQDVVTFQTENGTSGRPSSISEGRETKRRNTHPTTKPLNLMKHLVRLVTRPGGLVLDPFAGSGTTGVACVDEGMEYLLIEQEEKYAVIARARLGLEEKQG